MDNICERTTCTATQSSVRFGLSADKVIDGNIKQNYRNCSHTEMRKSVAWVMVDFQKAIKLKNVVIYYRNEGHWKPYRFRQYRLEVSNSSGTQQWIQCYKDNTDYPAVPSSIQNISCEQITRFLRVISTYDAPEDDGSPDYLVGYALLEICEIQAYGCNVGFYGPNCTSCEGCENCDIVLMSTIYRLKSIVTCSPNCENLQCNGNGHCTRGCNQGYWGDKCQNNCSSSCSTTVCNRPNGICNSCSDGYFGELCENICSLKCLRLKCNKDTGYCSTGCAPGYYGNYCNSTCGNCNTTTCDRLNGSCKDCSSSYYGVKCDQNCSKNCLNLECRQIDGYCSNGCKNGFFGFFCNMQCSGKCIQNNCSQNGTCVNGCKTHWSGKRCDRCDFSHYGSECSKECSVNCIKQTCHNITGFCTYGCYNGFYSENCEKKCSASCLSNCNRHSGECDGKCPVGKFGNYCDKMCNQNCKYGCNKNNGLCDFGCIDGKFGPDCLQTCSIGCISGCRQIDGSCTCEAGWQGHQCDECSQTHYGQRCDQLCSPICLNGTCFSNNGSCKEGCNINLYNAKRIQDMNQISKSCSSKDIYSALYGVLTILFLSIFLNIFLIVRNFKKSLLKKQTPIIGICKSYQNSAGYANTTLDDKEEGNIYYQELGEFSQPSFGDSIEGKAGYEELNKNNQPSDYDELH
ncbi:multiple epidermal growth factor-like domains protein 10 [Saccostrea cucullata]|uniref:multiple epidermal growth factor-like domains protein 10 n=1 Tax=Saccostrea cuccullata TaxID=36930 RepID=UPI002ED187BF